MENYNNHGERVPVRVARAKSPGTSSKFGLS